MLWVCYLLVFALLTTYLSPAAVGVEAAAAASLASCLECPLEDGDGSGSSSSRGKLSFNPIMPIDEDYLKTIALASSPSLLGAVGGGSGLSSQQKARLYHAAQQQQQHHQKILAQQHQQQRIVPSSSSSLAGISAASASPSSNLLHVYALLNKGSVQEPRLIIDEYYLPDPGVPLSSSRIAKKAERGMLVDVLDYVSKPDDRNRRVGQNMRSSG